MSAAERAQVQRLIELVSGRVIRAINRPMSNVNPFDQVVDETVTVHPTGNGDVWLPGLNITNVSAVQINGTTLTVGTYEWQPSGRLRRKIPANWLPGFFDGLADSDSIYEWHGIPFGKWVWPPVPLVVTYTHGYPPDELPDDIVGMVAELAAEKWLAGLSSAMNLVAESKAIDGYSRDRRFNKAAKLGPWSEEHQAIITSYRPLRATSVRVR